jgi:aminocarboxymuconate-semialdehyde decarboxylase
MTTTGAIDVHAHYVPPSVIERLTAAGADLGIRLFDEAPGCTCLHFDYGLKVRPFFETLLDMDKRHAVMERQGVGCQILSLWADVFGYGMPKDAGARWHRLLNECLARAVDAEPDRFRLLVSPPLQDAALAARELEYGIRTWGAVGAIVADSVEGANLGEAPLDEFWAAAEALRAPVFIHPIDPMPSPRVRKFALAQVAAYTMNTTLAVGSLISNGVLDRFPKLQLILSHAGGGVPYLIGRFDCMHHRADRKTSGIVAKDKPSTYLRRFHYDSIAHAAAPLKYLAELVGSDRVMLGTDYPFPPRDDDPIATIEAAGIAGADRERVLRGNAKALFGL